MRWGGRGGGTRCGAAAGTTGEVSECELLLEVFEERHFGRVLMLMLLLMMILLLLLLLLMMMMLLMMMLLLRMMLLLLLYLNNLKRRHERGAPLLPSLPPWLAYHCHSTSPPSSFSSPNYICRRLICACLIP